MKVICHMVITPNGYIAQSDGKSVSTPYDWKEFSEGVKQYNNFVVGRKTLDAVGEQDFDDSPCDYKVVVSSQAMELGTGFTVVHSPREAIGFLQGKVGTLFLVGGSELNTAFAKQGLIDEFILILEPFMISTGMPLLSADEFEMPLIYKSSEVLEGGRVSIRYEVRR